MIISSHALKRMHERFPREIGNNSKRMIEKMVKNDLENKKMASYFDKNTRQEYIYVYRDKNVYKYIIDKSHRKSVVVTMYAVKDWETEKRNYNIDTIQNKYITSDIKTINNIVIDMELC